MITANGRQVLQQMLRIQKAMADEAARRMQEEAQAWAHKAASDLCKTLQKRSTDDSLYLLHTGSGTLTPAERRKLELLGEELGINLLPHIEMINMGGGDPHDQDDWYAIVSFPTLTELLVNACTG